MVTFLGQTSIFWLDLFTLPSTLFFAFWSLFTLVKMTKKTWSTHQDRKKGNFLSQLLKLSCVSNWRQILNAV